MLNELNIKPLREAIADSIRDSIISGKLKPGERLLEVNISKALGVSRTPAREAFLQLDSEGFLQVMPRKGAVVTKLSSKDARDVYSVRSVLEGLAVRLAIENISNEKINLLISINDKLEKLSKGKIENPKNIIEHNHNFHDIINKEANNDKLFQMIDLLRKQTTRYNQIYLSFLTYLKKSIDEHKKIISAIKAGNKDLAEKIMRKHAEYAGRVLCEYINK
jgi:DNA-binding GntR family transcriptional regulator